MRKNLETTKPRCSEHILLTNLLGPSLYRGSTESVSAKLGWVAKSLNFTRSENSGEIMQSSNQITRRKWLIKALESRHNDYLSTPN